MAGLLALAWLASENRRAIPWRAVATGMGLLVGLAALFLKIGFLKNAFMKLNDLLLVLERATQAGTSLVFGYLGGGPAPFQVSNEASNFVLAFRALIATRQLVTASRFLMRWPISRSRSDCCSSARRFSEISRAILDAPMMVPCASFTGEIVTETGTSVPSLRWRMVS